VSEIATGLRKQGHPRQRLLRETLPVRAAASAHEPVESPVGRATHDARIERERAFSLIRRFGWNATSFQALEPGFRYFFDGVDACVAYVDTGAAWVAAGAPIAADQRLEEVATHFARAARAHRRRVVLFGTEQRFVTAATFDALQIGQQPVWNPTAWDSVLRRSRSLREQLRRARAKGVRIRQIAAEEIAQPQLPMRLALERLVERWLQSRHMSPMGFLVGVHLFEFLEERRIFVAETAAGPCAFVALVPVYARNGWLVEDLVRAPEAPNGTSELLVDAAMRVAAADGCEYVTLGLAPLAGDVQPWLRAARTLGRGLYDFSGVHAFKGRLGPSAWSPIYLSSPRGGSSCLAVYDSLVAFSQGSLLRFGISTIARDPGVVLRGLALPATMR
jgi:phosphatidylglycerol lysyltransferase